MMIVEIMTRMRRITHRKTVRRRRMIERNHRVLPRGRYSAGICIPSLRHNVRVPESQSSAQGSGKYVLLGCGCLMCYCCAIGDARGCVSMWVTGGGFWVSII